MIEIIPFYKDNQDLPLIPKVIKFPDGSQKIDFEVLDVWTMYNAQYVIKWYKYSGDEELFQVYAITRYLQERFNAKVSLLMPYIINARQDRVKSENEVFTLKYFAEIINSLHFERVVVFDPHSHVSEALINNILIINPDEVIGEVINKFPEYPYIYFPDEGAYKRYGGYDCFNGMEVLIGHKVRDWNTGKILGLEITDRNGNHYVDGKFAGESVLMIDDIVSYGGTLAYSADGLKKLGFDNIYAYASHTENSVLDDERGTFIKRLKDGTVKKLYTTDSLFSGTSEYIEVIPMSNKM